MTKIYGFIKLWPVSLIMAKCCPTVYLGTMAVTVPWILYWSQKCLPTFMWDSRLEGCAPPLLPSLLSPYLPSSFLSCPHVLYFLVAPHSLTCTQRSNLTTLLWKAPRRAGGNPRTRRRLRLAWLQRRRRRNMMRWRCLSSERLVASAGVLWLDVVQKCWNRLFFCILFQRCTIRNWRMILTTLLTGSTPSTCTEERVGMTTTRTWQTRTGLSGSSK